MSDTNPAVTDNPTLLAIAKILEVNVHWLLFGSAMDQEAGAPVDRQQIMADVRERGIGRLTDKSDMPPAQALTKPSAPKKAADGGKRGRRGR